MTTSKTKTYNRDAAILYAQKWANSFNPQYPNFEKIGVENSDCANFVSQCLFAGWLAMKKGTTRNKYDEWYYESMYNHSGSWSGAQSLRLYIKYNTVGCPRIGFTFLSNSQVGRLQKGDLVFGLEGSGDKSNRRASHVAMVSRVVGSTIYVYSHSKPKYDASWGATLEDTILCKLSDTIQLFDVDDGWQERYGTSTLKKSSGYSRYVENLQEDLNHWCDQVNRARFFSNSQIDGYFGSGTENAVKVFQGANALTADGLVGTNTKKKLYELLYW